MTIGIFLCVLFKFLFPSFYHLHIFRFLLCWCESKRLENIWVFYCEYVLLKAGHLSFFTSFSFCFSTIAFRFGKQSLTFNNLVLLFFIILFVIVIWSTLALLLKQLKPILLPPLHSINVSLHFIWMNFLLIFLKGIFIRACKLSI